MVSSCIIPHPSRKVYQLRSNRTFNHGPYSRMARTQAKLSYREGTTKGKSGLAGWGVGKVYASAKQRSYTQLRHASGSRHHQPTMRRTTTQAPKHKTSLRPPGKTAVCRERITGQPNVMLFARYLPPSSPGGNQTLLRRKSYPTPRPFDPTPHHPPPP